MNRTEAMSCVLLLCAGIGAAFAAGPSPGATLRPCRVEGIAEPLRCGELLVPEDHARPEGRRIKLRILVVPARTPDPGRAALFELAGGPGMGTADGAGFYASDGARHRQHRDVVLVDQRGTGESSPLRCPELEGGDPLEPMYPVPAVQRCRDVLSQHADLAQYTTAATVADLELVRSALGHERVDLVAMSYGTRVALAWMQVAPERIRAAVLVGTVPADARLPLWHARNAQETLDAVIADCRQDAACFERFGDLQAQWQRVLAVPDFDGPHREAFRTRLIATPGQRALPALIKAMAEGDLGPLRAQVRQGPAVGSLAEGLYLSVACAEDSLWITDAQVPAASTGTFLGDYRAREQMRACAHWNVPKVVLDYALEPLVTPTLLLAGERDYVTPVAWAQRVAAQLPNGRLLTVPWMGHLPDGLDNMACLDGLVAGFLEAPDGAALDAGCLESMRPPPFVSE
jgi:pimeloyl-ACP methyl ester carboxylesterase